MSTFPPIPRLMADRPVQGGMAMPWNALELADGTWDLAGGHSRRNVLAMLDGRCQACGIAIAPPFHFFTTEDVLAVAPVKLTDPPLHEECADYSAAVCPHLNGKLTAYRSKPSRAYRTDQCRKPGCDCGGWAGDDTQPARGGQPAARWFRLVCRIYEPAVTHRALERNVRLGLMIKGERALALPRDIIRCEPVLG